MTDNPNERPQSEKLPCARSHQDVDHLSLLDAASPVVERTGNPSVSRPAFGGSGGFHTSPSFHMSPSFHISPRPLDANRWVPGENAHSRSLLGIEPREPHAPMGWLVGKQRESQFEGGDDGPREHGQKRRPENQNGSVPSIEQSAVRISAAAQEELILQRDANRAYDNMDRRRDPLSYVEAANAHARLGYSCLSHGVQVHGSASDRVQIGQNLDLGGQAYSALYMAQEFNKAALNNDANGTLNEQTRGALVAQQSAIGKTIQNGILGEHQIIGDNAAFEQLRREAERSPAAWQALLQKTEQQINAEGGPELNEYKGKLCRDAALINTALAYNAIQRHDVAGASGMCNSAAAFLARAQQFDQTHGDKDAQQIKQLAEGLSPLLQQR